MIGGGDMGRMWPAAGDLRRGGHQLVQDDRQRDRQYEHCQPKHKVGSKKDLPRFKRQRLTGDCYEAARGTMEAYRSGSYL